MPVVEGWLEQVCFASGQEGFMAIVDGHKQMVQVVPDGGVKFDGETITTGEAMARVCTFKAGVGYKTMGLWAILDQIPERYGAVLSPVFETRVRS